MVPVAKGRHALRKPKAVQHVNVTLEVAGCHPVQNFLGVVFGRKPPQQRALKGSEGYINIE